MAIAIFAPIAQPQPAPRKEQHCINPATGRPMLDSNGYCVGNDTGGSRYGQDDRAVPFLPGVPGFDPHAR